MLAEGCHPPEKTFGGGSNVLCGAVQLKQTHTLSEKSHQFQVSTGKTGGGLQPVIEIDFV